MADSPVSNAKNFSKFVFAKIFPMVLSTKSTKKIHKITFCVLFETLNLVRLTFISNIHERNRFIKIEIDSKIYISVSFVSLPPQAIL